MRTDYIQRIVTASGIAAGETVLVHFWGEDTDKSIANAFSAAVASLDATPVLLQQARTVNRSIFQSAGQSCFGEDYFEKLSHFDTVLDVFAYRPVILGYELEPAQMSLYRRYISNLFRALMRAKRFVQIRFPTAANAEESALDPSEYVRRMDAAYDIDYDVLLADCISAAERMQQNSRYILRTGNGCELHFDLTGRNWHIDAGDGDWPCGEIYTAPVESCTSGTVYFDKLYIEDTGEYEDVTMTITGGKLTGSDTEAVSAFINRLAPEDRVVCEFGLGMNPGVSDACGYTVLDEKMAGSFHIAIGANSMFGGQNESKIHMDFVGGNNFELIPLK